jgi:hypothetical protein
MAYVYIATIALYTLPGNFVLFATAVPRGDLSMN